MPPAHRPSPFPGYLAVGLTILAPLLGGATSLWAEGTIALATGLLFIAAPPRRSLGLGFNIILGAIALIPLIQFMPARLFATPPWRATLIGLGVQLPTTWTPQPWLTIESACLLWLGLAWTYYLFSYDWDASGSRENVWDGYCLGILGLAAILVTAYALKWRVPFWPNVPEFGFFRNRNQTGNVLGLGGIMIYANAFQHLEHGRRRGWMWLGGLGLVCWALILNYSRGGIILFFLGALIWHIWWRLRADSSNVTPGAIAWGPLAILLALLLLAGGETLIRLKQSPDLYSAAENGRFLIQRDAFNLFKISPMLGIGLGNFRSLFSAHRHFFQSDSEAIHPESDWLWVATEMGALAPTLIFVGLILWIVCCLPFEPGTWRGMRRAAMICGIGFALHGLVDVSGHRIGSYWPAALVAATALNPNRIYPPSVVLPFVFRGLGLGFMAVAMWWFASLMNGAGPTTTVTVQRLAPQIRAATAANRYDQLLALTEAGLKVAPLQWTFHYDHGLAEAFLNRPRSEISRDFAVARFLMPNWPGLYLKEGEVLLSIGDTDLAFDIFKEGMNRLSEPWNFYAQIYSMVKDDADFRERWRQLGEPDKRCVMIFLQNATPTEFQIELNRLLIEDAELRTFTPAQLKTLFHLWYERGEKLSLAETLRAHPQWENISWRELARIYADYQDYRQAYETLRRHVTVTLPDVLPNELIESLATRFRVSGGTESDGLLLARAEAAHGQIDDGLAVLTALSSQPHPSPLVSYVEAELWARKGDWAKAWQAMWRYVEQARL